MDDMPQMDPHARQLLEWLLRIPDGIWLTPNGMRALAGVGWRVTNLDEINAMDPNDLIQLVMPETASRGPTGPLGQAMGHGTVSDAA
jgi:hypothetical protein